MSQELGRMERPSSEAFRGKRKLLLVPRVYPPPVDEAEGSAIVERYWDQVRAQVASWSRASARSGTSTTRA